VADPIAELLGDAFVSREDDILKLIHADGRIWGADWENVATHALFTSNPNETIAGFRSGGRKQLEMLLGLVWHGCY
jgi:hypothetical protein